MPATPRTGWAGDSSLCFQSTISGQCEGSGVAGYSELNLWRGGVSHSFFRAKLELLKAVSRVNYSKRYATFILKTQKRSVEGFVRL
jgi:hypothetical protein